MIIGRGAATNLSSICNVPTETGWFFLRSDSLLLGILPIEAAGHTLGHTAYRVGQLFVVGDLMHGVSLQLSHPEICASYDMDREQSVAARRRLMEVCTKQCFGSGRYALAWQWSFGRLIRERAAPAYYKVDFSGLI